MEDQSEAIRRRAYELWEEAGRPENGAEDFWYRAEQEIAPPGIGEEASARHFARDIDPPKKKQRRKKPT